MIQNNISQIVAFICGLLISFVLLKQCDGPKVGDNELLISTPLRTVKVKMVTDVDTVYQKVYKTDTVFVKVPSPVDIDTMFITNTKIVETIPAIRRSYNGSQNVADSLKISYRVRTTGTLDSLSLAYTDTRPIRTIIQKTTTTITKQPKGLYVGIGSNLGLTELSPSIQYVNNKNIYGIKYNVATQTQGIQNIGFTYSRKLF